MISTLLKHQPIDGMKIGLFGGSFNPAHQGHFELAKFALARLQLDYVWWMVSPQNPLKPTHETSDLDERLNFTSEIACHPRFVVTGLEATLGTKTTAQTLVKLQPIFNRANFCLADGGRQFCRFTSLE